MLGSRPALRARCARIGTHASTLAELMYREQGATAIRSIQGLLSLARKHARR